MGERAAESFSPAQRLMGGGLRVEIIHCASQEIDAASQILIIPDILSRLVSVRLPGNPTSGSSL